MLLAFCIEKFIDFWFQVCYGANKDIEPANYFLYYVCE